MKPALASPRDAQDFVNVAKFYLVAPRFRPTHQMWTPSGIQTLVSVIGELEQEATQLASPPQPIAA